MKNLSPRRRLFVARVLRRRATFCKPADGWFVAPGDIRMSLASFIRPESGSAASADAPAQTACMIRLFGGTRDGERRRVSAARPCHRHRLVVRGEMACRHWMSMGVSSGEMTTWVIDPSASWSSRQASPPSPTCRRRPARTTRDPAKRTWPLVRLLVVDFKLTRSREFLFWMCGPQARRARERQATGPIGANGAGRPVLPNWSARTGISGPKSPALTRPGLPASSVPHIICFERRARNFLPRFG